MPNRLAASSSPYLLQHAGNPVDWHEWGADAFAEASRRDVPLLLSVGYSTCHWCHVMAHESFEDPETAALMNDLFVNVKVDREERPDVDAVYMEAVQAMTGRGGWPMTVWLSPQGRPFYAGTYFPREDRGALPSFRRVLTAVAAAWRDRRPDLVEQADRVTEAISRTLPATGDMPADSSLAAAYGHLESAYDPVHGGFGGAPKFPQQPVLEFLLRAHQEPWAPRAGSMVRQTLGNMARGGIHDQLGGGFARYAVDSAWLVPHFEKMLYDNAQLARIYLRAWQELGVDRFRAVAEGVLAYLRRDLRHPEGGFYSAEDADSEGAEGRFYAWSRDEFLETVGPGDGPVAAGFFGITRDGDFEGGNVLHEALTVDEVAELHALDRAAVETALARARARLLERRSVRVRPGRDTKVVASWNGMALRALAEAGAVLHRPEYLDDARACARFLLRRLRRDDGRLLRSWAGGRATTPGFLEDQASVAVGLLALYAATGETEWYREAETLTRAIPELFGDPADGLFATGSDAESLVTRPRDLMDNPHPSGSSLAAEAFLLLSRYTGDSSLRRLAEETIRHGTGLVERYPSAVGHLLSVLHALDTTAGEVAVAGVDADRLAAVVWERFRPAVALAVDRTGEGAEVPLLDGRWQRDRTLAYVCEDLACALPVDSEDALRRLL